MATLAITAESTGSGSGAALDLTAIANGGLDVWFDPADFDSDDFQTTAMRRASLELTTSIDDTGAEQVQPGRAPGVTLQRVGWYVDVAGVSIIDKLTQSNIGVSRSMFQPTQTAAIETSAKDGQSTLGNPLNSGAPITGLKAIEVGLRYMDSQGNLVSEPLISNGIADSSERTFGDTISDTITVHDPMRRYVNERVSRTIVAGSNYTRGRVVRLLAGDAGVPSVIVGNYGKVHKQIELAKGDWLSQAQAIMDVKGGRLLFDREGNLVVRLDNFEKGRKPARWKFTGADLLRAVNGSAVSMGFVSQPEGYTKVSLRGTEQIERDEACGAETTVRRAEVESVRGIDVLQYVQSTSGVITQRTSAGDLDAKFRKTQEIITETTRECGEVIAQVRLVYGFNKREKARFQLDGSLANLPILSHTHCFVDEDSSTGPGFQDTMERWMLVERHTLGRVFDSDGYLTEEREDTERHYNPRAAVKRRADVGEAWDTADNDGIDIWSLGEGQGVSNTHQSFQVVESTVTKYERAGSYLKAKTTERSGFHLKPGSTYLYHDGEESGDSEEKFRVFEAETETWEQVDEQRFAYNNLRTGSQGEYIESESKTEFGSIPAAPRRNEIEPQRSDFETTAEFEAAKAADQFDQREIKAECDAPNLLNLRPRKELDEAVFEWAENEDELQDICTRLILKGQSPTFRAAVMAHARLEEGDWIQVVGPRGIFVIDGLVRSVDHSGSLLGEKITTFELQVYPRVVAA